MSGQQRIIGNGMNAIAEFTWLLFILTNTVRVEAVKNTVMKWELESHPCFDDDLEDDDEPESH